MKFVNGVLYTHKPCEVCPIAERVLERLKIEFHPYFTYSIKEVSKKTIFNDVGMRLAQDYSSNPANYDFIKRHGGEVPIIILSNGMIVEFVKGCDKNGKLLELELRRKLGIFGLRNLIKEIELMTYENKNFR